MFLGNPNPTNPNFEYSTCHRHYHFNSYAEYQLLALDGSLAATGHKQAFCLEDFYQYPWDGMMAAEQGGTYNCAGPQGIQAGWQDVYQRNLACQWIDVTDVQPGNYRLRIDLNTLHILNEADYANNRGEVSVTIPPDDSMADPTLPCTGTPVGDRNCGWTRDTAYTCTPGATISVGCSALCALGSCTGDTIMRVYEGDRPTAQPWYVRATLGVNDDSGCGTGGTSCETGGDCCSRVQFTCPPSGSYTVVWAPYRYGDAAARCTAVAHSP